MASELTLLGPILSLGRDPNVNVDAFRETLESSGRLAGDVIRIADSSLYGMEGRIRRLERAVLILGARHVACMAATAVLGRHLRAQGAERWSHSLRTGLGAQLIAACLRLPLETDAYLAGLLHEIEPAERPAEWRLPAPLAESVLARAAPHTASALSRPLVALVRAAHGLGRPPQGSSDELVSAEEAAGAVEELGLLPEDLDDVSAALADRFKQAERVLGGLRA